MALRQNDLGIGQTISLYQYVSTTPGRLSHTKGKEPSGMKFTGGTLFVDHCSKLFYPQSSLFWGW